MAKLSAAIRAEGLNDFVRDLKRASPEARKELRAEMRELAGEVADDAKQIAQSEGLVESGDLLRRIKPAVRGTLALIRSGAEHRGFPYPARLEFGDLDGEHLQPAAERNEERVVDGLDQAVGRAFSRLDLD